MASSNRHWPSLFKSKACNSHHHQWQHDINPPSSSLLSSSASCQKPPYSSSAAAIASCEDRTPEPKPRWNPKPEQIRILEAIFNSGMVNPPRDEIRRIRIQLQEYGQVGDANVFYWFQNRKSRSKHKQRLSTKSRSSYSTTTSTYSSAVASSSSSSSSERSTSTRSADKTNHLLSKALAAAPADVSDSPTASVNQKNCFQYYSAQQCEFSGGEPFFFPAPPAGYCLTTADLASLVGGHEQGLQALCPGIWGDLMATAAAAAGQEGSSNSGGGGGGHDVEVERAKMQSQHHHIYGTATAASTTPTSATIAAAAAATASAMTTAAPTICSSPVVDMLQGVGEAGAGGVPSRSVVFINEVAFEVGTGRFNVREFFGEGIALLHPSGQQVLVDEWGVTLIPLQHGASYYLV